MSTTPTHSRTSSLSSQASQSKMNVQTTTIPKSQEPPTPIASTEQAPCPNFSPVQDAPTVLQGQNGAWITQRNQQIEQLQRTGRQDIDFQLHPATTEASQAPSQPAESQSAPSQGASSQPASSTPILSQKAPSQLSAPARPGFIGFASRNLNERHYWKFFNTTEGKLEAYQRWLYNADNMRPLCGNSLNAVQATATIKAKANKKVIAKQTNSRTEVCLPPMQTRSKVFPKVNAVDSLQKSRFPSSKSNHRSAWGSGEKRAKASTFVLEVKRNGNAGFNYEPISGYQLFGEFEPSPSRKRKRGEENRARSDSTVSDKEPGSPESDDYKPPAKTAKKAGRNFTTTIYDKALKPNNKKRQTSAISKAPTTADGSGKKRQKGGKDNKSDKDLLVLSVKKYLTHLAGSADNFAALPSVVVEQIAPEVKNIKAADKLVLEALHLYLKPEKDEHGKSFEVLTIHHDKWKKDKLQTLFYERVKKACANEDDNVKNSELASVFYEKVSNLAVENHLLTNTDLANLFPKEIAVMCFSGMPLNQYRCQLRRSVHAALILHEVYTKDDKFKNKTLSWNKTAYQGVGNVDVNKSSRLGEALTDWGWAPDTSIPELYPGQTQKAYAKFDAWRKSTQSQTKDENEKNAANPAA